MSEIIPYKRQILDDLFDAYTILGKGTYVSLYDVIGQMTKYSPAAVDLFGLIGEYVPAGAMNWGDWVHPEDRRYYENTMNKLIAGTAKYYDLHYRVRVKDGSYSLLRFIGSILRNETTGMPELIGGIMINEGLMEYTDPITILRNQYGFYSDIVAAMEMNKSLTLLMIGVSNMSSINEEQGYSYGNKVLQAIGWILQEIIGLTGTIYRMDGPKFIFLTEQLSQQEVESKYEQIYQTLLTGINVENNRKNILVSGGLVKITNGILDGRQADERAIFDFLSYTCRESRLHKNGKLVRFNGIFQKNEKESLELITEIRNSVFLDYQGFSMSYQIIVDVNTEKPSGVESFINWQNEKFGNVPNEEFLPSLEMDFVFEELGYWILKQAMTDGKKFLEKEPKMIVAVPISQVQLEDEFFVDEVQKIARKLQFPMKNLCLELDRSCRLLNVDFIKNIVEQLRSQGVKFVLNDFGKGLSSIDFLIDLSPDYVKFDKQYTQEIEKNQNRQIIHHLSALAASFGTKVCVAGIDNKEIFDSIKEFEVSRLQGQYFSAALSSSQILEQFFE